MSQKTYTKTLCSICCLGYRQKDFIIPNLQAIWDNDYKNIEILVLDDGSNDGSIELLKELQAKSPSPMLVVEQVNTANIGTNMNKLFEMVSGEFVFFMALDDVLLKDCISSKIEIMLENPNIGFITNSLIDIIDESWQLIETDNSMAINKLDNVTVEDLLLFDYQNFHSYYIQGTCFRSKLIEEVGGYDEDMIGDDIILRIKISRYLQNHPEYSFKILKTVGCKYRIHSDNIHKNQIRQIQIVTEALQRFFPDKADPQILISWVLTAIKNLKYEEYIKRFTLNARASNLLLNNIVQKAIKRNLMWYIPRQAWQLIYKKEKIGDKRVLTFFNCIKYTYNKKYKLRKKTSN